MSTNDPVKYQALQQQTVSATTSRSDTPVQITMEPAFLNKKDTCAALGGISVRKLEQEVRRGRITPQVFAGRVMFTPAEVRRYAAEQPTWEPR
jgi:hypothetical protein